MATLHIDGRSVTVPDGATLLTAARELGIAVPTLCHGDGLEPFTSCMLCVVEDTRTGVLHPACSTPAQDGMALATDSAAVREARREALELLLSDHVGDCEAPCTRACPAGLDIPAMLRCIAAGDTAEALRIVKRTIALPAVLGRVCPAPCEKACRRGLLDTPVGICLLKRFAADADLAAEAPYRPDPAPASGRSVAVVGAGPAGLAAAEALARDGHACTVFERREAAGGGLRTPALRAVLPPETLEAEIRQIARLGMTFATGVEIGRDVSFEELKRRFDAVILACGETAEEPLGRFGLQAGPQGIRADRRTFRTSDPAVFACGGAVRPGRLAVQALAQGRAAACAVGQFLRGEEVVGLPRPYQHRLSGRPDAGELVDMRESAGADPDPRRDPAWGVHGGYAADEAQREAARCLHCDCRKPEACRLRRHADAYGADARRWRPAVRRRIVFVRHGNVVYEPGKCIACGLCVRIAAAAREPLGLAFIGRGFDVRVGVPFGEDLVKGLGRVAADCVAACPTGALAFQQQPY